MSSRNLWFPALILVATLLLWAWGQFSAATGVGSSQVRQASTLDTPPPLDGLRYPDLRAVPSDDLMLDTEIIGGLPRFVLRFSTTIWNAGPGPLELRGDLTSGQTLVYQRIFGTDGPVTEFFSGNFVFHPGHNHWHFENFARYELWTEAAFSAWLGSGRMTGEPNWLSSKTAGQGDSFCLRDSRPMPGMTAAPFRYADCDPNGQGISVGWSDVYARDLPDQWIEVGPTPLPDGAYVLRIVADPANLLYESPDKADPAREAAEANEAITRFTITDGIITPLLWR